MLLEENLKIIKDAKLDIELLRRKNELLCQENDANIEGLQDIVKSAEGNLGEILKESGEKKLECKLGWCSFREMPDKWDYDDGKIVDWCKKKNMPYYHTVFVVEKMELKKAILEKMLPLDNVPGVTVTTQEPKFGYKIKGGL